MDRRKELVWSNGSFEKIKNEYLRYVRDLDHSELEFIILDLAQKVAEIGKRADTETYVQEGCPAPIDELDVESYGFIMHSIMRTRQSSLQLT